MAANNYDSFDDPEQRRKLLIDQMDPSASGPAPGPSPPPVESSQTDPLPSVQSAPNPPGMSPGVSATKPAAPAPAAGGFDRIKFRDAWMASPDHSATSLQALIAAHPEYATGVTAGGANGDKITLPGFNDNGIYRGPESIDGIIDAGGRNAGGWTGNGGGSGAAGGVGGAGGIGGAAGAGGVGGVGGNGSTVDAGFRAALLKIMSDNQGPVDMNNPALAAQSNVYRNARERSAQQERAAMAERAAATGLNSGGQGSGAFDSGIQGIIENAGQDEAGNDARLMGGEVQARRQQLMQALDMANSVGARTEAMALQKQLAEMDNSYRYSALGQSGRQFDAQLGENSRQFDDNQAYRWTDWKAQQDRDAYLASLRG